MMEPEGTAPSAGALGKGHAALSRPHKREIYGLNGSAPLALKAPDGSPLSGASDSM